MEGSEAVRLYTCGCLNVELRCATAATNSFVDDNLRTALGNQLTLLMKPEKRVVHEWLLREKFGVCHCLACNTNVFSLQPMYSKNQSGFHQQEQHESSQAIVVSDKLKRNETWIPSLRGHPSFSECFQILVDPTIAHQLAGLQEKANHIPHKQDSLVPGYMEESPVVCGLTHGMGPHRIKSLLGRITCKKNYLKYPI
ncbi:hypothetical protein BIW11_13173 [Tropilaelaps mercedesae]|uniref:Uncharacterized protein n=1 Tax=Tropilaelaps mercedesae TaxID=418985 RepID=A0A1V9X3P0_9ACAR|nr:hypothetical protein BIW11_13173 [Tropilaelaps mercedesae]